MTNRRSFLASLAAIAGVGAFVKRDELAGITTELRCPYPPVLRGFDGPVVGMHAFQDRLYIATADSLYSWDGDRIELVETGRGWHTSALDHSLAARLI